MGSPSSCVDLSSRFSKNRCLIFHTPFLVCPSRYPQFLSSEMPSRILESWVPKVHETNLFRIQEVHEKWRRLVRWKNSAPGFFRTNLGFGDPPVGLYPTTGALGGSQRKGGSAGKLALNKNILKWESTSTKIGRIQCWERKTAGFYLPGEPL